MTSRLDASYAVVRKTGIPEGWTEKRVSDLVRIVSGGTPDRNESSYWRDGGIPWITPTDLTANNNKYISKGTEHISEAGFTKSNARLVPVGSIIFSTRGTVGNLAMAGVPLTTNQSCEVLVPRDESVCSEFLYYLLNYGMFAFHRLAGGTTFGAITRREIARVWLAMPEPDEQAAIARVLDAVDKAIDRAYIAIEKAQATRLALMQAAFHYEMTSEPKHDTDAGRIPQSWEALKGRQAFTVLTGGNSSVHALKPLRGEDVADAWFMKVDDFNLPANFRQIVTTQIGFVADKNPSFKLLPLGTIIIAKRGAAILKNRVRTTAVPVALDPNLMAIKVRDDILSDFFRYQLEWRNLARYIESSGVPQLNNKDLYPRWFVRPPEEQQQEIVAIISAAEQHEDALHRKLSALVQLKKSLMHDLLTGSMRVDPKLFKELNAS